MINKFFTKHSKLSIIIVYNLGTLAGLGIFYFLIPILMGYPKEVMELSNKIGISYNLQCYTIAVIAIIIGTISLFIMLKDINKWQIALKENNITMLRLIRERCINIPYRIYVLQVSIIGLVIPFIVGIVCIVNQTPISQFAKIMIVVSSLCSTTAVFSHIFSKRLFVKILIETYKGEALQGERVSIRKKIFLQILPVFVVAILFTATLGYSRVMEEKGDLAYSICKLKLDNLLRSKNEFNNLSELFERLKQVTDKNIKIGYFAVNKAKGNIITPDTYTSGTYFRYLAMHPIDGDRVFGDSFEMQGVVANVKINGEDYYAGIRFETASKKTADFFIFAFVGLIILNIFVLSYFSKNIKDDISLIAKSLTEIAENEEVDLNKNIAVVSNDEFGDLVIAFNKIQEKQKDYIQEIREQHQLLIEKERLASIGQLMGGMAHNLRTPIMSLSGAIEKLKDLSEEYDESIDDVTVKSEDHHMIAKEMSEWLENMKPYCSYMSDVITTVKKQTMPVELNTDAKFTIKELVKRIELLMQHELQISRCELVNNIQIDLNTLIKGDISVLVQVLNNLIQNAIHSYDKNGGIIEFNIILNANKIRFVIKDYGKGIADEIQNLLFKKMATTKGENGTGLGLYISYSNVKVRFNGDMRFESENGIGTAFYIELPCEI